MDFSKIKIVEKANPRKAEVEKQAKQKEQPSFHLHVDYKKQKMTLSTVLFETLSLKHNSLAQGIGPDNELLIITMPGNSGVFAKAQSKGEKGRAFKNLKFVTALQERGWLGGKFNLELLGEHEGKTYYQVVPFGSNDPVVEEEAPAGPKDDAEELQDEQGVEMPTLVEPESKKEEINFN